MTDAEHAARCASSSGCRLECPTPLPRLPGLGRHTLVHALKEATAAACTITPGCYCCSQRLVTCCASSQRGAPGAWHRRIHARSHGVSECSSSQAPGRRHPEQRHINKYKCPIKEERLLPAKVSQAYCCGRRRTTLAQPSRLATDDVSGTLCALTQCRAVCCMCCTLVSLSSCCCL